MILIETRFTGVRASASATVGSPPRTFTVNATSTATALTDLVRRLEKEGLAGQLWRCEAHRIGGVVQP